MEMKKASDDAAAAEKPIIRAWMLQRNKTIPSPDRVEKQDGIGFDCEWVMPIEKMRPDSDVAKSIPETIPAGVIRRDFVTLSLDLGTKCDTCGFCQERSEKFCAVKDSFQGNEYHYYFPCPYCSSTITVVQRRGEGRIRTTVIGKSLCKHGLRWYHQGGDKPFNPTCSSHTEVEMAVGGRDFTRCAKHELQFFEDGTREFWDSHMSGKVLYYFKCIRCFADVVLAQDAENSIPVPDAAPSVLCVPKHVFMNGGNAMSTWLAEQINNGCLRNNTKPYRCIECRQWDPASFLGQVKAEDLPDRSKRSIPRRLGRHIPLCHIDHSIQFPVDLAVLGRMAGHASVGSSTW